MTALLTTPLCGALVLAALVMVLVQRTSREAARKPPGSAWLLAALLALFALQVAGRFMHG